MAHMPMSASRKQADTGTILSSDSQEKVLKVDEPLEETEIEELIQKQSGLPSNSDDSESRKQKAKGSKKQIPDESTTDQAEEEVLGDLKALESVLSDLISQRHQGRNVAKGSANSGPSSSASIASQERPKKNELVGGTASSRSDIAVDLDEDQAGQDVAVLEEFLKNIADKRTQESISLPQHGVAHRSPNRLSQLVAINDLITKDLEKVDEALRKTLKKNHAQNVRQSDPSSRTTSPISKQSSGSSSTWTESPALLDAADEHAPGFSATTPLSDATTRERFIRQTILRALDIMSKFPDQNLYLVTSKSRQIPEPLPFISNIFKLSTNSRDDQPPGKLTRKATPRNMVDSTGRKISQPPAIEVSHDGTTVFDHHFTVPSENETARQNDTKKERTASLPETVHKQPTKLARHTAPSVLSSNSPKSDREATNSTESMQDREVQFHAATSPTRPDAPGTLRSSMKSFASGCTNSRNATVPTCKCRAAATPVSSVVDSTGAAKKKVSFADIPSTSQVSGSSSSEKVEPSPSENEKPDQERSRTREKTIRKLLQELVIPSLTPTHPRLTFSTPSSSMFGTLDLHCCSCGHAIERRESSMDMMLPTFGRVVTSSITHVMSRTKASTDVGRSICGSTERWITRVNSRTLHCATDDFMTPCGACSSNQFDSILDLCCCPDNRGTCSTTSNVANCKLVSSCASCKSSPVGRKFSSKFQTAKTNDATSPSSTSTSSTAKDVDEVFSSTSQDGSRLPGSVNRNVNKPDKSTSASVNKNDRKRTKTKSSEK